MQKKSLQDWLQYQQTLHPQDIELGLERIKSVLIRLQNVAFSCPVVLVGGTNGKGSTVALLQSIYHEAGYSTACYTSPHLIHYNERIQINGEPIGDEELISAFAAVEQARQGDLLTYFEFGTLAALKLFAEARPDILLLEVGLGGRLDAVNILDADVSIVTNVALDHMDWLGDSVEKIAVEKAGIARAGKPFIVAQHEPPSSLLATADEVGANISLIGRDFSAELTDVTRWQWQYGQASFDGLPTPALAGDHQLLNAATALCAIHHLSEQLPVYVQAIHAGLQAVQLAGRFQTIATEPTLIVDVAHNPAAASVLAALLRQQPPGRIHVILAMQSNRAVEPFARPFASQISSWFTCPLSEADGHAASEIASDLRHINEKADITECLSVAEAVKKARQRLPVEDTILLTGSFYTVSEASQV